MGWLWAIIVGFVLGLIAKAIIPGKQHSPLWLTTIFGMLGRDRSATRSPAAVGVVETAASTGAATCFQLIAAIIIVALGDMLVHGDAGQEARADGPEREPDASEGAASAREARPFVVPGRSGLSAA